MCAKYNELSICDRKLMAPQSHETKHKSREINANAYLIAFPFRLLGFALSRIFFRRFQIGEKLTRICPMENNIKMSFSITLKVITSTDSPPKRYLEHPVQTEMNSSNRQSLTRNSRFVSFTCPSHVTHKRQMNVLSAEDTSSMCQWLIGSVAGAQGPLSNWKRQRATEERQRMWSTWLQTIGMQSDGPSRAQQIQLFIQLAAHRHTSTVVKFKAAKINAIQTT